VTLYSVRGDVLIEKGHSDFAWSPEEFDDFLVATDFDVVGLSRMARSRGLGVPCIAVRAPPRPRRKGLSASLRSSYAVTVVMRFEGSITGGGRPRRAVVEAYDPMLRSTFRIGEREVPLEIDLTTPLVHTLRNMPEYSGFKAMFEVEEWSERAGLYMFQQYRPGRLPVVFVHGLMSSPETWIELFNDLLADPVLRERYQFWFFVYPTGNPIPYSAAVLRESLLSARAAHDPEGRDPSFSRTVLIGHSMGGLLTRMQIQGSGDRLWNAVSNEPLDEMDLTEEQKALVRRMLVYDALPFVDRVVFMATPHRGSEIARGLIGRIGASLIKLPVTFVDTARAVRPSSDADELEERITGIGNLSPDSALLVEMSSWPLPPDLEIHSIVGNREAADTPGGTDGVVPYWSSHLDGAVSEKIVRSGHSVQKIVEAIKEVRRILHLHLKR
jgi:hypothetical protein